MRHLILATFLALTLVAFVAKVDAKCCRGLGCNNWGRGCCGAYPCNIFCCNCDGGCSYPRGLERAMLDKDSESSKTIMERADTSLDGALDLEEATEYLHSEGKLDDKEAREIDEVPLWFYEMDLNEDGLIQHWELDNDYDA